MVLIVTVSMNKDCTQLKQHINRLEGQLNAVKAELGTDNPDCKKVCSVLFAASRSFQSLKYRVMRSLILTNTKDESPIFLDSLETILTLTK